MSVVQPLHTPEAHSKTSAIVAEFGKNEGPQLHAELVATDAQNKHTSYISGIFSISVGVFP